MRVSHLLALGVVAMLGAVCTLCPRRVGAEPLDGAAAAMQAGDYQAALTFLDGKPLSPETRFMRACALTGLGGRHAEVLPLLTGLERDLPFVADRVLTWRGEAELGLGRPLAAAASFRKAAAVQGGFGADRLRVRHIEALIQGGRAALAHKAAQALLERDPGHPHSLELRILGARALEAQGKRAEAAQALQDLRVEFPQFPEAEVAEKALQRLAASGVRPRPLGLGLALGRIRKLRADKRLSEAQAELQALSQAHKGRAEQRVLARERVRLLLADEKPEQALPVIEALREGASPSEERALLRLRAEVLADLGQLDRGVAPLLDGALDRKGRMLPRRRADVNRAFRLFLHFGAYARALELARGPLSKEQGQDRWQAAWLAYRTGQHEAALQGFVAWAGKRRGGEIVAASLYWQGRTQDRMGQTDKAVGLFEQVLAKHPRSYYGLLARSRLHEKGKRVLPAGAAWCSPDPTEVGPPRPDRLANLLEEIERKYGLKAMRRAQVLESVGLREEARGAVKLAVADLLFALYRGRVPAWFPRPEAERAWRGGPPPARRWDREARRLHLKRAELLPAIGQVVAEAGEFYLARRLGSDKGPGQAYPRAYEPLVMDAASRHGVSPYLLWSVMRTESTYRPDAISPVGATGLMQIMPGTGRRLAALLKVTGYQHQQLFMPSLNIELSAYYLRALMDKFSGQVPLVAAAYNGGPHNVSRWLRRRGQGMDMDEFVEEIPFTESRRYAKKVLRLLALHERVLCGKDDRVVPNSIVLRVLPEPRF